MNSNQNTFLLKYTYIDIKALIYNDLNILIQNN